MTTARLIWITPDAENMITYTARVSNPKNQANADTAPRLLRYCLEHGHVSIFEMANMCIEIETTRAISAQILRHRSFSFQEYSQRYASTEALGAAKVPELRRQDTKNRQNSIDDLSDEVREMYTNRIENLFAEAEHLYECMVQDGVAKECARNVLPLATPTRLYMNGTIRSWIHYLQVRTSAGTQLEHRNLALQIQCIFAEQLPTIAEAAFHSAAQ